MTEELPKVWLMRADRDYPWTPTLDAEMARAAEESGWQVVRYVSLVGVGEHYDG